jgi:glyoxylase-like metal-dependent hydrolase (beta-lactamase superfamily II)
VAQRAILDQSARYERTAGMNAEINARHFGRVRPVGPAMFSPPALMPNLLFDERLLLAAGELTFKIFHCRGETDDACWVWCPERRVVCSGDFVINAVPNAGNPQKVQRYPWDWADGLREIAACDAVSLCPGHGGPVVQDPAKVRRLLLETAEYLDSIVNQTLAAMNDGPRRLTSTSYIG